MNTCFFPRSLLSLVFGLGLAGSSALRAQDPAAGNPELLAPPQLEKLLGPIALYPDALVALILPASTVPTDVVLAARFLNTGGDPARIDEQPWNDSIKALARYPVLVKWMDENLQWTSELGSAFLNQSADVMNSVQRLRAQARATGALTSNPQQQVVMDDDLIMIVPTEPEVIYVPYYDPEIVYYRQPGYYSGPFLTFGFGFPIGFWLSYDLDWRTRVILVGDRHHNWHGNRDWDRHARPGGRPSNGNWRAWQAPAIRPAFARPTNRPPRGEVFQPRPLPGAPAGTLNTRVGDGNRPRPEGTSRDQDRNRPPQTGNPPPANRDSRDRRVGPTSSTPVPEANATPVLSSPTRPVPIPARPTPGPANNQGGNQDRRDRRPAPTPEGSPAAANPPRPAPGPVNVPNPNQDSRGRPNSPRTPPLPENSHSSAAVPIPVPVPSNQPPPIPTRIQSSGPIPTPVPQPSPGSRGDTFRPPSRPQPVSPEPRQVNPPPRPANPPPAPPPPKDRPRDQTKDKDKEN